MIVLAAHLTPLQMAKCIARSHGVECDDDLADYALWERTAFPVCGIAHWVEQLHEFFGKEAA